MKCDKLKVHKAYNRWIDEEMPTPDDDLICNEVYLKSEADKVIAHHKYKRCLAMAERCKDKIENVVQYNEHDDWLIINEYWERWHERWLELAEKFKDKEAK